MTNIINIISTGVRIGVRFPYRDIMNKQLIKESVILSKIQGNLKGCKYDLQREGVDVELSNNVCCNCHSCDPEW